MSGTHSVLTVIPPPEGYIVNFSHPKRQGVTETYWIVSIGNFLALTFLAQKLYTKIFIDRRFQSDDGGFVTGVIGVHAWELPLRGYDYYSVLILVAPVAYAPCNGFAKLTLLLFYRRLSPQTWFMWTVNASITLVIGYTVGIFFSLIFACSPIEKSWNAMITTGSCINRPALYITTAVLGIATDVVLLGLPVPMVLRLQMPALQKAGLLLMFAVGSLTLITSIVRLVILLPTLTATDQTWAIAYPCLWICIEANLLIICGSFPTLQRFLRRVSPKLIGESRENGRIAPAKAAGNSGLRTFGDSGVKKFGYDRFDDSNTELTLMALDNNDQAGSFRPDLSSESLTESVVTE
ncbi:hypothetical protein J7T55_002945 [Diaporthe amygdali]|uniref:uncharacterized protein n=1 Tax=Phomopsis amygdali TaxID=1214568 RepID=UPI0022FE5ED7|nr:uncharacterized protein J7T55_002945 [Diaporthe amygdali]KAJ0122432.1 hypothetical protein J7T55_002945 [Diaporthe amygdali]